MSNEHIAEYIDYYISLESPPGYAILLRGEWGSGKSWFIKKYIEKDAKKYLFVSLYGITSYKEIEDAFFQQLHPVLASKGMKIFGAIAKGLLKTTIKIDVDKLEGKDDVAITSAIPDINIPDYLKNLDDKVLIFDDLERCSIPIYNVLGYINQFVENNGLKVIIVANEDEIIKQDKTIEKDFDSKKYLSIKEKIIGKSFDVHTDFSSALHDFISLTKNADTKELLKNNESQLKVLFETAHYENLRHLKQAILDFDRFYSFFPEKAKRKDEFVEHLLNLFFSISFELKKGVIKDSEVNELFSIDLFLSKEEDEDNIVKKLRNKYSVLNRIHQPINPIYLKQFFINGTIDKLDLENSLTDSLYFRDENTPDWIKLWYYYKLNDTDFENLFTKLFEEFSADKITEKYVFIHIVGMLLQFCDIELIPKKKEEIINLARKKLKKLKENGFLKPKKYESFPENIFQGLQYHGLKISEFQEFLRYAADKAKESEIADYPTQAQSLLQTMITSMEEFEKQITLSNTGGNLYYDVPILKYINVKTFHNALLALDNDKKNELNNLFRERYKSNQINSKLKEETSWLKKLLKSVKTDLKKLKGKLSGHHLGRFANTLENAISILESTP